MPEACRRFCSSSSRQWPVNTFRWMRHWWKNSSSAQNCFPPRVGMGTGPDCRRPVPGPPAGRPGRQPAESIRPMQRMRRIIAHSGGHAGHYITTSADYNARIVVAVDRRDASSRNGDVSAGIHATAMRYACDNPRTSARRIRSWPRLAPLPSATSTAAWPRWKPCWRRSGRSRTTRSSRWATTSTAARTAAA